jgi:hypothetical protein
MGSGPRVVERDCQQQVDEVRDPARVAPRALLDAAQPVLRGVRVDLQARGSDAQVEVGAREGAGRRGGARCRRRGARGTGTARAG